jgi:hypothetical protein
MGYSAGGSSSGSAVLVALGDDGICRRVHSRQPAGGPLRQAAVRRRLRSLSRIVCWRFLGANSRDCACNLVISTSQ